MTDFKTPCFVITESGIFYLAYVVESSIGFGDYLDIIIEKPFSVSKQVITLNCRPLNDAEKEESIKKLENSLLLPSITPTSRKKLEEILSGI